jgi:hypothetical protein
LRNAGGLGLCRDAGDKVLKSPPQRAAKVGAARAKRRTERRKIGIVERSLPKTSLDPSPRSIFRETTDHLPNGPRETITLQRKVAKMAGHYSIRRDFVDIFPFIEAVRAQADSERDALGFLPEPAYAEAARQRKLILLIFQEGDRSYYAGHLLFGGIFPVLRVRQISITAKSRRNGQATTLLRALIAQGEKESYSQQPSTISSH